MSNGFSILVIDDEVQIRKLLEISLEANDYKVHLAVNGKEGITAAASYQPYLILLDLGLPDQDGQEVLVKLREWYHNPIIILTVKSAEEEIVKALDNGANDYLTKPFELEILSEEYSVFNKSTQNQLNPSAKLIQNPNKIVKKMKISNLNIVK